MVHNESKGKNFKKMLVAEQTMIIVEDSGETYFGLKLPFTLTFS